MLPLYLSNYLLQAPQVEDSKSTIYHVSKEQSAHFNFPFEDGNKIFLKNSEDLEYKKFFGFLWDAYLMGYEYWFNERQYTEEVQFSGIRIDLDPLQDNPQRFIDNIILVKCVTKFAKILYNNLRMDEGYESYAAILLNKAPYYVESKKAYKEGIHIRFPGIKISLQVKQHVLQEYSVFLQEYLQSVGFKDTPILDSASSDVPVQLYGTIRKNKTESHVIHEIYKVVFRKKILVSSVNPEFYGYRRKENKTERFSKINMILELSIHYEGNLIKKDIFVPKENVNIISFAANNFIANEEQIKKQVDILINSSYLAREVCAYVNILSQSRGQGGNYTGWLEVINTIISIDLRFKPIAIIFSMKCDLESWNRGGLDILDGIVEKIMKKKLVSIKDISAAAICKLKAMAKYDQPAEYSKIKFDSLESQIGQLVSGGMTVTHNDIARLVHYAINDRLKYIQVQHTGFDTNGHWIEYITNERSNMPENIKPFIYKWYRHNSAPDEIDHIISNVITKALMNLHSFYKQKMGESKDSEHTKMIKERCRIIDNIKVMCGNKSPIDNIKSRCQISWFKDPFISNKLDKEDNVLGVGNGLLVFGKKAEFIDYSNNYLITRTTDTHYVKYDANSKYVKKVESVISDIIPDEKKRRGLLMHLSLCFVHSKADRYFNIFFSGGASGKTILMNLMENALGMIANSTYGPSYGYYDTIEPSVFSVDKKDPNGVDHHLRKLEHPRFVQCPEGKGGIIEPCIFKKLRDGIGVRGLFQEIKNIRFGGIIAYITNHQVRFMHFDYALARRFLYHHFVCKFVPEPKNPNEKKENLSYKIKSLKDKNWGCAFLSILVHHWDMFQELYNDNVPKIYSESGLEKESQDYLDEQNHMSKFITNYVKLDVEGSSVTVLEFCKKFTEWFKKTFNVRTNVAVEDFINEAKEALSAYIKIEGKIELFDKVELVTDYI